MKFRPVNKRGAAAAVLAVGLGLTAAPRPARALTIDPEYDSSVTESEQTLIANAISFYEKDFTNPITVDIEFMSGASQDQSAGSSDFATADYSYANYLAALHANATNEGNAVELGGYDSLGHNNTAATIQVTAADAMALGCTSGCAGNLPAQGSVGGTVDGIVTVESTVYGNGQTIYHEIDEVLGIGGAGSVLPDTPADDGDLIGALDLFRYSALDTPSLTNSASAAAYFSLDAGLTDIANFNQAAGGDYGDLTASPCYVQSYQVCSNPQPISLTTPEGLALQAIGYDTAEVPEPAALALLGSGIAGLGLAVRRRRRPSAGGEGA